MNTYRQLIGKINYWLFLIVVFSLPFPQVIVRYACVIWMISWALEGRWLHKPYSVKENKIIIPFLFFCLWYLWNIISGLWVSDLGAWKWVIERYITFGMIVPIVIWGFNNKYDWRQTGKVFVAGCVTAMLFYFVLLTYFFHHREVVETLRLHPQWDFTPTTWYTYFESNISYIKHRLFLCSIELFGIVIAFELYSKRLKILLPFLLIMLSAVPLTGSRQSILTCAGIAVAAIIYKLPRFYRFRYGVGILLLGIILGGGLLMLHPRMQEFNFSAIVDMREVNYNEHDVRFNIWGLAIQQPSDYFWRGLGAGQSTNYMLQRYKSAGFSSYLLRQYNCHNQYIEEMIELGIGGLVFFILAWLSIPFCACGRGRKTAVLFTTIFMMNMLTECMFGRFCGIALWAFAMLYIYIQYHSETDVC